MSSPSIEADRARWPRFVPAVLQEGYRAVHALPLRLRGDTIGALNLFGTAPGRLSEDDAVVAQTLADVATISILQERALRSSDSLAEQLQGALNSRIVIEQAKDVIAERRRVDMDAAFRLLRGYARRRNERLIDVAHDVVSDSVDLAAL